MFTGNWIVLKKCYEDLKDVNHVKAYNDCFCCQNSNKNILKYWMIMVKFLKPGHTYMECDKDFGLIEKCKKFLNNVYVPSDWMDTVKQTLKKFHSVPVTKNDFLSIAALQKYTKISAPKDDDGEAIASHTIRWIRVEKRNPFGMLFKETLND
ncbi:hypothetical protein PR048_028433, partial [Dryococelus australis]